VIGHGQRHYRGKALAAIIQLSIIKSVQKVAIIGAGVSGLTCGVLFAEHGYATRIFAETIGQDTTSAAAGAIWYPYDVEPMKTAIAWALDSYNVLIDLSRKTGTGVSIIELRTFCRVGEITIPNWATPLGARSLDPAAISTASGESGFFSATFCSGFSLKVPLMDTTIYLDYLAQRFIAAGGVITPNVRLQRLEDIASEFAIVINCAGIGARRLVSDHDLEPHRGQVVIVPKLELRCAVVCDDTPLMYAIPRKTDCLFGGTNDLSDNLQPDPATTESILNECCAVLKIDQPRILAERVGLRPFRRSGVRLQADRLQDGRTTIHNYGHGGAGFTLSWGCAREVLKLAQATR
jgi:D-amino-acid oxidase